MKYNFLYYSLGKLVNNVTKKPKLEEYTNNFEEIDRVLTNKEKDSLTCADRSNYNTK